MSRPLPILPALYYHDHFREMVAFVLELYGEILGSDEKRFLADFENLTLDAQCLFIRLCNRKKFFYTRADLCYGEIGDIESALAELEMFGWIRPVSTDDFKDIFSCFKKEELFDILDACGGGEGVKKSWGKEKVVSHAQGNVPREWFENYASVRGLFTPARCDELHFFLYLYFGKTRDGLTTLALRDLGVISVNERQSYSARFRDLSEAQSGFFYNNALKNLKSKKSSFLEKITHCLADFPAAKTEYVRGLRNKLLFNLGNHYERCKDTRQALFFYRLSDCYTCRERLVRILHAQGQKEEVANILSAMIADPSCDEEHSFAADFYERKFNRKRIGVYTELLRNSDSISADDSFRGAPECAALNHYKKDGWNGTHVENALWHALFGLIFWEELFEHPGSFGGAFDYLPHLLRNREFHTTHADAVGKKLSAIEKGTILPHILATFQRCKDTQNGIFGWHDGLCETITHFVTRANPVAFFSIMARMTQDYHAFSDGFPDLLLFNENEIRFVEVKSEGDQISRRQLVRLMQLRDAGFKADILNVTYRSDPNQLYVVVDVETTGGRPPFDRVTEIGAVKMQNGVILEEWTTLINPGKHIPAFITQLTGISDDMVKDAPAFADIAQEFLNFMDGCVFAAHNVNFDYGFIASEYRRLEIPFRMPKLCTCASMRKKFPGLPSYSLAALCREFAIPLKEHHRALNDARAAAGLMAVRSFKIMNN